VDISNVPLCVRFTDELTFSLTPSSAKYFNNFNSLNVLKANMECSNGATFLIATFVPDGRCVAETTTPYAPSPITSITSYAVPNPQLGPHTVKLTDIEPDFTRCTCAGPLGRLLLIGVLLVALGRGAVLARCRASSGCLGLSLGHCLFG
jgi:hypothetical protein